MPCSTACHVHPAQPCAILANLLARPLACCPPAPAGPQATCCGTLAKEGAAKPPNSRCAASTGIGPCRCAATLAAYAAGAPACAPAAALLTAVLPLLTHAPCCRPNLSRFLGPTPPSGRAWSRASRFGFAEAWWRRPREGGRAAWSWRRHCACIRPGWGFRQPACSSGLHARGCATCARRVARSPGRPPRNPAACQTRRRGEPRPPDALCTRE